MRVPAVPAELADIWRGLAAGAMDPSEFDPRSVAGLPEPAYRWLVHAIKAGAPLSGAAELTMRGKIKLNGWRPFTARQVSYPPHGFIWAARARVGLLFVTGYDRYSGSSGEMRWQLLSLVPITTAGGDDVTRSAAGRLAGEAVLVPTAFAAAEWAAGPDSDSAIARWDIGGSRETVTIHVGPEGQLRGILMDRWGNPSGMPYAPYPFGVTVEEERRFGAVTIPSRFSAGWWWGTERQSEGEFFRAEITTAHL